MDYSKCTNRLMLNFSCWAVIVFVGAILLLVGVVKAVKYFLKENAVCESFKFLFFNNKESIIAFIFVIIAVAALLFMLILASWVVADIPYAINRNFSVSRGVVVSQHASGSDDHYEDRVFGIKDLETGETVTLYVNYTPIRRGEIYEVIYLPHTKRGAIVRKIENVE